MGRRFGCARNEGRETQEARLSHRPIVERSLLKGPPRRTAANTTISSAGGVSATTSCRVSSRIMPSARKSCSLQATPTGRWSPTIFMAARRVRSAAKPFGSEVGDTACHSEGRRPQSIPGGFKSERCFTRAPDVLPQFVLQQAYRDCLAQLRDRKWFFEKYLCTKTEREHLIIMLRGTT
jgi:hypothetical protein